MLLEQSTLFGERAPVEAWARPKVVALRPYQEGAIAEVRARRSPGERILVVAPTGAGKTIIASQLIVDELEAGGTVLFIAHRTELIAQTYGTLLARGIPERDLGIVMGDGVITHPLTGRRVSCRRPLARVQIASIDTLRSRAKPRATLVIVDEAHRALAKSYRDVADAYPEALHVGLTATPYRADGRGLGDAYRQLVIVSTPRRLMDEGFLVEPRCFTHPVKPDLGKVTTTAGEYDQAELGAAMDKRELVGNLVEHWARLAEQRRTVVFATNVAHSRNIVEAFRGAGVAAEHLDGETPSVDRAAILRRIDTGETLVVSNAMVLCLDAETEILTSAGWVGIDAMTGEHLVANWHADASVTFGQPLAVFHRARAEGEAMAVLSGRSVDIRVTEGHDVVHRANASCRWAKHQARDLAGVAGQIPACGLAAPAAVSVEPPPARTEPSLRRLLARTRWNIRTREGYARPESATEADRRVTRRQALRHKSPSDLTLDECRFVGFWLGDGSRDAKKRGGTEFILFESLGNPKIVAWVDELVARLGFDATRRELPPGATSQGGYPRTHPLVRWGFGRGTGGGSQERHGLFAIEPYLLHDGSDLYWGLDARQFDALLEGLWLSDGNHLDGARPRPDAFLIHNARRALLDRLQAIASVRSWRTRLAETGRDGMLILSFTRRAHFSIGTHRFVVDPTPAVERVWCVRVESGAILTRRRGTVAVLGNCEGWDQPSVKCCILAAPTKSRAKYIQQKGRVVRPWNGVVPTVLDHAGNILEHGLLQDDFEISLEGRKKKPKQAVTTKECPGCFAVSTQNAATCWCCGMPFGSADSDEGKLLEEKDGQLVEVRPGDVKRKPTGEERDLRSFIHRLTTETDQRQHWEPGTTNQRLARRYHKGRGEMTLQELKVVAAFLETRPWDRQEVLFFEVPKRAGTVAA